MAWLTLGAVRFLPRKTGDGAKLRATRGSCPVAAILKILRLTI
jgi:hypothetical protein